ncbi:hypothetical protein BX616_007728 [Lobosporangium transversale]|uniref:protein-tyrosine-phosphatase n=1 Tax=Lobosporangium transversale TaxID=64571 RepID=A0A1Y2GNL9_9FUNG|nr:protein-tyrosine phosphatase-like protein [Lobosporangium transversale]KAF9918572.1 hypothetical protein BX616_007728 [Lobosporangium transversale]ORZ16710.1 protein-tyrosine phosphatase-like protein [Lobosporangium transversale]|eukprot:XP_021881645.1 protein-tyrosine phosphatase-like protein [Lobosporangium transversale]
MPPVTQINNITSGPLWEPYPKGSTMERRGSWHKSTQSQNIQFNSSPLSSLRLPLASTSSLPSTPSASTKPPTLEDLEIEEMSTDRVSELVKRSINSRNGDRNIVLLLDMRPLTCYATSTIKSAINVSVPNVLLKRPMYSLKMVMEQLRTEREVEAFSNWRKFSNIVVFDATGTLPVKGSPIFCIIQKFRQEGCSAKMAFIHGGYNAFAHSHASLCYGANQQGMLDVSNKGQEQEGSNPNSVSETKKSSTNVRSRLHLGSLPEIMAKPNTGETSVCQTPMMENPNINPLFESVRLAMGLNTSITEEVAVRLPLGFTADSLQGQLPSWLDEAIHPDKGKSRLAKCFQKIEGSEKKRLALLMAPQEMTSNKETKLSISAGLEKGLKNRYNHIWPFDQTRVKIKECQDEEDDYINASFLNSPFGNKSYIATQAPLPSTFQDFWKIVWEQGSQVVVMLTREFEMGRIKCHQYWPSSEHPIMDLGLLEVKFINERRLDGFNDTILVRQMCLRHRNRDHTQEEKARSSTRIITQIQYTGWPDFGVPETPMDVLRVIYLANSYNNDVQALAGPMVIHCSAGCGRTGAFCTIDSVLSGFKQQSSEVLGIARTSSDLSHPRGIHNNAYALNTIGRAPTQSEWLGGSTIDAVYATVNRFREQRLSMVQCLRQYVFCYEAIVWQLVIERDGCGETLVSPSKGAIVSQAPCSSSLRSMSSGPAKFSKEDTYSPTTSYFS